MVRTGDVRVVRSDDFLIAGQTWFPCGPLPSSEWGYSSKMVHRDMIWGLVWVVAWVALTQLVLLLAEVCVGSMEREMGQVVVGLAELKVTSHGYWLVSVHHGAL